MPGTIPLQLNLLILLNESFFKESVKFFRRGEHCPKQAREM